MKHLITGIAVALIFFQALEPRPAQAAEPIPIVLGTATPGGGFELYGKVLAEEVNRADPGLKLIPRGTAGSEENLTLLESNNLDVALVASLPASEAFEGLNRNGPTPLTVITAIYPTFGAFAVRADSPAKTFSDLVGKRVAWGTESSGLTLLGRYVSNALGLDPDKDFDAVYLQKAGDGARMVASGELAAQWGGGIGWPNFTKIMNAGGRLVGFTEAQAQVIQTRYPFLQAMVIEPGSYPGQNEPLQTVGSFSFLLASTNLPNHVAYRLAKAIHQAQPQMALRLEQAKDTLPRNTFNAVRDMNRIHPGVRRYLGELGLR